MKYHLKILYYKYVKLEAKIVPYQIYKYYFIINNIVSLFSNFLLLWKLRNNF